jgi:hypothetical protein
MQLQGVDVGRQLGPEEVAALRPGHAGSGRQVPVCEPHALLLLAGERGPQLPQVLVEGAMLQEVEHAACEGTATDSVLVSFRRSTSGAKRPAQAHPMR